MHIFNKGNKGPPSSSCESDCSLPYIRNIPRQLRLRKVVDSDSDHETEVKINAITTKTNTRN